MNSVMVELLAITSKKKKDSQKIKLSKYLHNLDQHFKLSAKIKSFIEISNQPIFYFIMVSLKLQILAFAKKCLIIS